LRLRSASWPAIHRKIVCREEFGKLTGSNEQQAKGVKNQAAGAARWKAAFAEQAGCE